MHKTLLLLVALLVGLSTSSAVAQQSHDALAQARALAKAENQRVLLLLAGGTSSTSESLTKALEGYRDLGKLVTYEYQLAAVPASSVAGKALSGKLALGDRPLPLLAVLDAEERVLGALDGLGMTSDGAFSTDAVRGFLEGHQAAPRNAREVLAEGLAEAKRNKRHAFVYLSAPW